MHSNRVPLHNEHWYKNVLKLIDTRHEGKVTISWNRQVQTGRTVPINKTDIIIRDHEKGTCMLIDVAI
jgi:hypothetical protein